ncbi:MAG: UDP-N-acetylglucosamine 1-carboxyvinyltransferase, partial [Patescibacteria group bacterium]
MRFIVQGNKKLEGEIEIKGSKNAATKALVASLLTDEECILENFPRIGDAEITFDLCRAFGSEIKQDGSIVSIKTPSIKSATASALSRKNRISILALGPLLAREGKAEVPVLGGDKIGHRPVDIHLEALRQLGAEIEVSENSFIASAVDGLRGAKIHLRYPSVGATESTILAAVLAKGKTTIKNAAIEPEIINLIKMLQNMGAIIGLGTDRMIYIEGVKKLKGVRHKIIADRNEAASFACLAVAGAKNKIKVKGAIHEHLITFLNALRRVGGEYRVEDDGIV